MIWGGGSKVVHLVLLLGTYILSDLLSWYNKYSVKEIRIISWYIFGVKVYFFRVAGHKKSS